MDVNVLRVCLNSYYGCAYLREFLFVFKSNGFNLMLSYLGRPQLDALAVLKDFFFLKNLQHQRDVLNLMLLGRFYLMLLGVKERICGMIKR